MFDQCAWPDTSLTDGLHHSPPFAGFVKVLTNLPDILNFKLHIIIIIIIINNTAENTRMHEYVYLKTTKLYILLLHTGVNNVYQATLLFL